MVGNSFAKGVVLSLVSLLLCILYACEQESEAVIPQPGERTVLVYFAGDNDLSGFVREDINELKEGVVSYELPVGKHLLIYVDIGGEAYLSEISYRNGEAVETVIKTYPARNSTGLAETQEVFDDVFSNPKYEAASYGLVYWSHCDGWIPYPLPVTRWIGQDTGEHADNRMNLSDFEQVLQAAPHFDFILFDACFMQSIEVAYELRDYVDYYISSPTETPGPGAPYDAIFSYLFENGAASALAETYFEVYDNMYKKSGNDWPYGVSICAINSAALGDLAAATRQALQASDISFSCAALRQTTFDYDKRGAISHVGYYDYAGMMERVLEPSAYAIWKKAFDDAVVFWNTTEYNYSASYGSFPMHGANGVSHYIPSSPQVEACEAYHSLDWYEAAGIASLGW